MPTYPSPPTHTLESKETKAHTLECKKEDQKSKFFHFTNVNKRKNHLTKVNLESKKQVKKMIARRQGSGGKFPSNYRKKPCPTNFILSIHTFSNEIISVLKEIPFL